MEEETKQMNNEPADGEMEKTKKERDEYLDGWKRAKADLINYKKEEAQRAQEFSKFATELILFDLLSVLDSFELGLATFPGSDPMKKGMEMTQVQLRDILKKYGLEKIDTKIGNLFDPGFQEGVEEIESKEPLGTIVEIISSGYRLNGKVIRPVRVKISKGQINV